MIGLSTVGVVTVDISFTVRINFGSCVTVVSVATIVRKVKPLPESSWAG
jgi:hypothetical protein